MGLNSHTAQEALLVVFIFQSILFADFHSLVCVSLTRRDMMQDNPQLSRAASALYVIFLSLQS
jgi:hypothetical protein